MNLQIIILGEISQKQKYILCFHLHTMLENANSFIVVLSGAKDGRAAFRVDRNGVYLDCSHNSLGVCMHRSKGIQLYTSLEVVVYVNYNSMKLLV